MRRNEAVSVRTRTMMFIALITLSAMAFVKTLTSLVTLSSSDLTASHVILVPAVTVMLVLQSRETIFATVRFGWAGLAIVAVGLVLGIARSGDLSADALSFNVAALVFTWIGSFLLVYGNRAFRAALFPLLFLVFTIPIPNTIIAPATLALKSGSADVVSGIFSVVGVPFHRQGFIFSLPALDIEVADQCSGIRSSIALTLTGLLAGHAFLDRHWSKALLLAFVVPVTIVKNGIRIVTLTMLGLYVDPEYLTGQLHHEGGVVFFALALGMLAPVLFTLRRLESRTKSGAPVR